MSGKDEGKTGPISLTQEEVNALTKGGKGALSVRRRRFRDDRSAKRSASRPQTEKSYPQAITRREMAAIVKGKVSPSVRKRIASASPPAVREVDAHSAGEKAAPSVLLGQQKYLKT